MTNNDALQIDVVISILTNCICMQGNTTQTRIVLAKYYSKILMLTCAKGGTIIQVANSEVPTHYISNPTLRMARLAHFSCMCGHKFFVKGHSHKGLNNAM